MGATLALALTPASALAQVDAATTLDERAACAEAAFSRAEAEASASDDFEIVVPPGLAHDAALASVVTQIQAASHRAQALAYAYEPVPRCRSPRWTMDAYTRQAEIYEALAAASERAIVGPARERLRQAMAPQLRAIACLAIVRYVLVVRGSRAGSSIPEARERGQTALDRLGNYPFAMAQLCVAEQQARDSSFSPLTLSDMAPLGE